MPFDNDNMHCSFCGRSRSQVNRLVQSPNGVCICDDCIRECEDIIGGIEEDGVLIVEDTAKKANEDKKTTTSDRTKTGSGSSTTAKTGDDVTGLVTGLAFLSMLSAGAIGLVRRRLREE